MRELLLGVGASYLVGSIPFGIFFSKWFRGIDPRQHGSRNIGFTNVFRTAGWLPGVLTLTGDMGKGLLSVVIAQKVMETPLGALVVGGAVVLGHNHSFFLKLKGGKGVATAFGVLLGLDYRMGLILLTVWIAIVAISRISSLGAISSFILLPFMVWWLKAEMKYILFGLVLSMMVLLRHRSNMVRLWHGEEPKMGSS